MDHLETSEPQHALSYKNSVLTSEVPLSGRVSSGLPDLDEVLGGGLLPHRTYLVRGDPGTGKTTLGLHFLADGIKRGETCLFIAVGEFEEQIRKDALSQGFDISNIFFLDISMSTEFIDDTSLYTSSSPDDVVRETIVHNIIKYVKQILPQRVFLDSMSQLCHLAPNAFQTRRQTLAFLQFFVAQGSTLLLTSETIHVASDADLQIICDAIINLNNSLDKQTLSVSKYRGSSYRQGVHTIRLSEKGMEIFPHILPEMHLQFYKEEVLSSGIPELDALLHGGLERGTVSIITGPSGVGKTTMGIQFFKEAAIRGERSLVYIFDEAEEILLHRCEAIGIPIHTMIKQGSLLIKSIEPLHFTPDEFASTVRKEAEQAQTSMVMFDSISGYRLSMQGEDMVPHLHALCKYLQNSGLTVILINDIESITGGFRATEIGISYMADNIIFLRYLETQGEIRRAVGVLKKRMSDFERGLRSFKITRYGIEVGSQLTNLRGILSGIPELVDQDYKEQKP